MTNGESPKRVLIVGAGFRAANNFLPSFALRPHRFSVVGIMARTRSRSQALGDRWGVTVYDDLSEIDPTTIDIVAVTVPTHENKKVLRAVLAWSAEVGLVVDTPIAWKYNEYRDLLPLLRRFPAVVVAEDFMNLPQFELALRAARDGLLGKVRSVTLFNTGYRYHGLALLRAFAHLEPTTGCKRTRLGTYSSVLSYRFPSGMRGNIVGPYRQAITGGIVVEGERGVITQAAEDEQFADVRKKLVYRLSRSESNGRLSAFVIENSNYRLDLPEMERMEFMPFDDRSDLNVLKNVGLTRIFESLLTGEGLNAEYGYENGLYDSFASRLAIAGVFPVDPFTLIGKTFMELPRIAVERSLKPTVAVKSSLHV